MADLELTLTWLGMDRYLERFIEAGFDSWETVLEITENDLDVSTIHLLPHGSPLINLRSSMWTWAIGENSKGRLQIPNDLLGTQRSSLPSTALILFHPSLREESYQAPPTFSKTSHPRNGATDIIPSPIQKPPNGHTPHTCYFPTTHASSWKRKICLSLNYPK